MTFLPNKLLIVPGHASFTQQVTVPLPQDITDDDYWVLQSFQAGEPPYYVAHIKKALELVDSDTLLVFSGGHTRQESGLQWSEARTYDEIAKTFADYPAGQTALEEYARDSYQNVDFSIRLFGKRFAASPLSVTVVGWQFKRRRFELHATELGISPDSFTYVGVNDPPGDLLAEAEAGEAKTVDAFLLVPRGDSGELLRKRQTRDPFNEKNPYE